MKSSLTFLVLSLLAGLAQAQTRPVTKPSGTTPAVRPAATLPANTTTAAARPTGRPAPATAASPNRRQELYDQYHGVTKKATPPVPAAVTPAERQASRPAPQPANPMPAATASTPAVATRAERPVSLESRTSGVRIGIRGGVTYPVYLEKLVGIDPTAGFVGGVVFNVGQGILSFQPELNYVRYALKASTSFSNSTVNVAADLFEVPLFLKIASGSANGTRFFLNVGPYGTYASSASINGQKVSPDNTTGRFSFGAAAGVGAALRAGPGHLTIELRGLYVLGNTESRVSTNSNVINTQATLGYMIPLGGR